MLLVLNLPMAGVWVRVLAIPRPLIYAGILVFATLATYTLNNSVVDLVLLYIIGALGFVMRLSSIPVAPAVTGLIPGPLAAPQFRRAPPPTKRDATVFFTPPPVAPLPT